SSFSFSLSLSASLSVFGLAAAGFCSSALGSVVFSMGGVGFFSLTVGSELFDFFSFGWFDDSGCCALAPPRSTHNMANVTISTRIIRLLDRVRFRKMINYRSAALYADGCRHALVWTGPSITSRLPFVGSPLVRCFGVHKDPGQSAMQNSRGRLSRADS